MKQLLVIALLTACQCCFAQDHELSFDYRIGFSTTSIQRLRPEGEYSQKYYRKIKSQYDQGFTLTYKYRIWRKLNLFVTGGLEFSQSMHYQPLIDEKFGYHLDNIAVTANRYTFHLGLDKQFTFYDSRLLLNVGFHLVNRHHTNRHTSYTSGFKSNYPEWILYTYKLETYYDAYYENDKTVRDQSYIFINADLNLQLKFKLTNAVYLNAGVNYSRNNYFFYDYQSIVLRFTNGAQEPESSDIYVGSGNDNKVGVRDHYLYFSTGVAYKLGKN